MVHLVVAFGHCKCVVGARGGFPSGHQVEGVIGPAVDGRQIYWSSMLAFRGAGHEVMVQDVDVPWCMPQPVAVWEGG